MLYLVYLDFLTNSMDNKKVNITLDLDANVYICTSYLYCIYKA